MYAMLTEREASFNQLLGPSIMLWLIINSLIDELVLMGLQILRGISKIVLLEQCSYCCKLLLNSLQLYNNLSIFLFKTIELFSPLEAIPFPIILDKQ